MTFLAITSFWAEKAEQFSVKSNSGKKKKKNHIELVSLHRNEILKTFVSFYSLKATYEQAPRQLPSLLKFVCKN